jgi:hypothetical protein
LYALCYQAGPSEPPDQVVVFAADAQGSDAPKRVIAGPSTTLGGYATNLAVGATGKEALMTRGNGQVHEPGCTGSTACSSEPPTYRVRALGLRIRESMRSDRPGIAGSIECTSADSLSGIVVASPAPVRGSRPWS